MHPFKSCRESSAFDCRRIVGMLIVAWLVNVMLPANVYAIRRRPSNNCKPSCCQPEPNCRKGPPCICIIRPYFYLPYTVLHYARQHPDMAICNQFTTVSYATSPAITVAQSCDIGNCLNVAKDEDPEYVDQPFLDSPEYPYDILNDRPTGPNDSYFQSKPGDQKVKDYAGVIITPQGNNIPVQVFLIEMNVPGNTPSKEILAFGVEIKNEVGPNPPVDFRVRATPVSGHKYLYEFKVGQVSYEALASRL